MERTSRRDARARVVGVLAEAGAVSRADLARRAALAPSTVSAVVSDLQAAGLVVEPADPVHPPERGSIGRPPVLIALHRRAGVVAGIDFGKRHLRMAISDLSHTLLAERHRALDADLPAREAISLAKLMFEDALDEAGVQRSELVGRRHGPARARCTARRASSATPRSCPGWVDIRAEDAVAKALGRAVEVENDANLGALGEWMWGAGRGADHMAYVKAATGIGAGFIVAGAPYVGAGGTAGEIGHTVVDPAGPICRCGNRGCLETLAGAPAVLSSLRDVHGERLTLPDAVALRAEGRRGLRAGDRRRRQRDRHRRRDALQPLQSAAESWLAAISGPPASCCWQPLRESLRRGAIRSAADDVEVVQGELGERAEVLGAVALVLSRGEFATIA